jgi:manganese/iron transport system ATP-binding protein
MTDCDVAQNRVEFLHVSAGYGGKLAIEDINLQVPHGMQIAVVGPNGAGKSTLFKALVRLLPIRSGEIRVHGLPLGHHQDCVAYVPQREEVDWRFPVTVRDVVMMGRFSRQGWLRPPSAADRRIVSECLEKMDIASLAKESIAELSGGQQQRVFLARALAQEPHILLMDEPFTGIDAVVQEKTLSVLDQLRHACVTVLVSTHDIQLASTRFDRVAILRRRLIAYGPPADVMQPGIVQEAFGNHAMMLEGALVVDPCCSEETHA